MGLSSGKLTLHPVHDKTKAETNDAAAHKPTETVETASQLVNGDANAISNVPAIDDVAEPTSVKLVGAVRTETIESVDDTPGPNGTVNVAEGPTAHDAEKKKNKNPLGWIKRRLSKKSSTEEAAPTATESGDVAKATTEITAAPSQEQEATSVPSAQVTETAESLVDDVLSSAMAAESEKVTVQSEPAVEQPVPTVTEEPETAHEEPHTEQVEAEEHAPRDAEPEDHPSQQEETAEETLPVVDTNNTNVEAEEPCNPPETSPDTEDVHEAVSAKLAGLDLTNGHPEQPVPAENGLGAEHHEEMMNGE